MLGTSVARWVGVGSWASMRRATVIRRSPLRAYSAAGQRHGTGPAGGYRCGTGSPGGYQDEDQAPDRHRDQHEKGRQYADGQFPGEVVYYSTALHSSDPGVRAPP